MANNTQGSKATVKLQGKTGADIFLTVCKGDSPEDVAQIIDTLVATVKHAKERYGLEPAANDNGHSAPMGFTPPATAGAAPTCKYHGPMIRSKKFNGWYCPHKMGDGSYCKETVKD